jgi:hypothetical protein
MGDGAYGTARALFPRLAKAVCSAPWLEIIATPGTGDGEARRRFLELYPFVSPRQRQDSAIGRRLMERCPECQRICPRNEPYGCCCDCEADTTGEAFETRVKQAARDGDVDGLRERSWGRPTLVSDVITHPGAVMTFADVKVPDVPVRKSEKGNAIYLEDAADSSATADRLPLGVIRAAREAGIAADYRRFGIQPLTVRFYDPIRLSQLERMPPDVACEIRSIVVRHDHCQDNDARRVAAKLRKACEPLGRYRLVAQRGDILLKHGRRMYCLFRYETDYPSHNISRESGRAIGCEFTILSESRDVLLREIAYFNPSYGVMSIG